MTWQELYRAMYSDTQDLRFPRVASLEFRDMWTFVTVKGVNAIGEAIQKRVSSEDWARDLHLRVNVPLVR